MGHELLPELAKAGVRLHQRKCDAKVTTARARQAQGAPDILLERCVEERVGNSSRPLTPARREEILRSVDSLADEAYRALAVAYRRLDSPMVGPDAVEPTDEPIDESIERDLTWVGVVGIFDPPREEAAAAIAEAHSAGIRTVMITGDHPRTAVRIADELGLTERAGVMTGAEIEKSDDETLVALVRATDVYARVTPEHKLRLVQALRADSHIVSMTGDGVNDAPGLRHADIGVAMGRSGTDVAREAATMVLHFRPRRARGRAVPRLRPHRRPPGRGIAHTGHSCSGRAPCRG